MSFLESLRMIKPTEAVVTSMIIVGVIHLIRKDGRFLSHVTKHRWRFYLVDYLMLLIPISLISLLINPGLSSIALLSGLVIVFLPGGRGLRQIHPGKMQALIRRIPIELFEWRSMIRTMGYFAPLLYLVMLAMSWTIPGFVLSILFILLMLPSAFEYFEPKEWIVNPKQFMFRKIIRHSKVIQFFGLPIYVLFIGFNPSYWYFVIFAFLMIETLLILAISMKYARYAPERPRSHLSNVMALFSLLAFIPGVMVVLWPIAFYYYRRAKNNMTYYYA